MLNIVLSGCMGKLGQAIVRMSLMREDMKIIAGVDINDTVTSSFPVFASFSELPVDCDVILDASNPIIIADILKYATDKSKPLVLATTGYNDEQLALINAAAKKIPVFMSYNMSIGINLLCEISKAVAKVLGDSFDVEIVEAHHNQKLDAPSGTAIMLADSIKEGLDFEPEYTFERKSRREKRAKNEIGIHSIRGGTIIGEHEIIFAGHDEIIKLSHSAMSKEIFAVGALNAVKYISNKPTGKYTMKDFVIPISH